MKRVGHPTLRLHLQGALGPYPCLPQIKEWRLPVARVLDSTSPCKPREASLHSGFRGLQEGAFSATRTARPRIDRGRTGPAGDGSRVRASVSPATAGGQVFIPVAKWMSEPSREGQQGSGCCHLGPALLSHVGRPQRGTDQRAVRAEPGHFVQMC